jgi:hypothetical protein
MQHPALEGRFGSVPAAKWHTDIIYQSRVLIRILEKIDLFKRVLSRFLSTVKGLVTLETTARFYNSRLFNGKLN